MLKKLVRFIFNAVEKYLYVPSVAEGISTIGAPMPKNDDEVIVSRLQIQRKSFIDALESSFDLKNISFCSVAAGFGAEEYLLKNKLKKLVLLEPSAYCFNYLISKYKSNAILCPEQMERADFDSKFDFIYTSSPTNWMQLHPSKGIPEDFISFLDKNLEKNGIFFARLYGGLHENRIVKSDYFYTRLIETLSIKFIVQEAFYNSETFQARVVITRTDFVRSSEFDSFLRSLRATEGLQKVVNNNLVHRNKLSIKLLVIKIFALGIYVPFRISQQVKKLIQDLWRDICTNVYLN